MATLNYAFKELSCKIVYYGCGLCGKTTNLIHIHKTVPQKFRGELVSLATEQDRTLFFDFLPLDLGEVKGFKTKFQLYTVPGQVYYNATRKLVLRGVDGLLFVADSQRDRFQENIDSLENLKQNLAEYGYRLAEGPNDYEGIPWVIQYNKRDMPQVSTIEEMEKVLNPYRVPSLEAVAVSGQGVKDTLKSISSLVIKKLNADTAPGSTTTASKPADVKPVPTPAPSKSDAEYEPISNEELEGEEKESARVEPKLPDPRVRPPEPAKPAPLAMAEEEPAPTPTIAGPPLSITQDSKTKVRGIGMGSAYLTLSNATGDQPGIYQMTGKISFLAFFGSTWSRKLRLKGEIQKNVGAEQVKFLHLTSEDGQKPELEVFVRNDQNKTLYVEYVGRMGLVHIVPPGMKPLS